MEDDSDLAKSGVAKPMSFISRDWRNLIPIGTAAEILKSRKRVVVVQTSGRKASQRSPFELVSCFKQRLAELGSNGPNGGFELLPSSGEMCQWGSTAHVGRQLNSPFNQASNFDQSSWKAVYSAITNDTELRNDHRAVIQRFLLDDEVLQLLQKPFDAYAQPSAQSKAAFETKTSAINVTPSSTAKYDIKQIKEDSLWLSKAANIDEVSALRLVIEECQCRTSIQLLGNFSEEELVGIRDAAGNSQSSIPVSLLERGLDPEIIQQQFTLADTRKQRILRTYFSERRYLLKCSERLIDAYFSKTDLTGEYGPGEFGKGKGVETPSWKVTAGENLVRRIDLLNITPVILGCIGAVSKNLRNIDAGSGWADQDGDRGNIGLEWAHNQLTEATFALELLSQFILYILGSATSQLVLDWFRLQQAYGFFSNFESVFISVFGPRMNTNLSYRRNHLCRSHSPV